VGKQPRRWGIALAAAATIVAGALPVTTAAAPARQGRMPSSENLRYRRQRLPPPSKTLPLPSQAEITKVIDENRSSIKVCYQRALERDSSLTYGKMTVKLSIGISGRVKHVSIEALSQFRNLLEPCIKEAVSRWIFPQASEEYGTEFPFIFQKDVHVEEPVPGCSLPFEDDDHVEERVPGCSITVNTIPWSEIWIDGRNTTRHTPLVDWKLPCGKHKLTFKRPDMDINRTETITVRPGEKFRQQYSLATDG